jgi:serine/threonine protein phosphatase 1
MSRTIVIGDIHGCYVELCALLERAAIAADDAIISVGDLVDRGPDPDKVLEFFRARPNTIVLMGNHERKHVRRVFSYAQEITRLQLGAAYDEWVTWMSALPYFVELDDAIVVHAGLVPDTPIAEQKQEILCGSTAGEQELDRVLGGARWHERWTGPKPVIFGHHVVDSPLIKPGLIYGIDTGACHGGALTGVTLPDFQIHSVPAREDHWARIKREWQVEVLARKPWAEMAWDDLDAELRRFADVKDAAARDYVAALREWRAQLEPHMAATQQAIVREATRLQSVTPASELKRVLSAHAVSGFMFQALRGRLDLATFRKQCRSPRRLNEIAAALGLSPLDVPIRHR